MGSLGPGTHKVLFEPSEHLWWVWGLILNTILPLLPSYWGFSFVLGHGVSVFGGQCQLKQARDHHEGQQPQLHDAGQVGFRNAKSSGLYEASLQTKLVEVMESQLSFFKF